MTQIEVLLVTSLTSMFQPVRNVYNWAAAKSYSPRSHWWLGLVFLSELIFFLPLDGLLILFCMHNPQKRFIYASLATLASILVAFIGYEIGFVVWDSLGPYIVGHLVSEKTFHHIVTSYNTHEHVAVFTGSLLPIPFKAITVSAGFCQLALAPFLLFVGLARALRFFFLAELMYHFGDGLKNFIDRHFNRIVMVIALKIALTVGFFWLLTT